jgi:hypothetical protein
MIARTVTILKEEADVKSRESEKQRAGEVYVCGDARVVARASTFHAAFFPTARPRIGRRRKLSPCVISLTKINSGYIAR